MKILAIDTSCDETAVAITDGRKVIANAIYSQILIHKKWGGVVPAIAKRAHEERIDLVINSALSKSKIKNQKSKINLIDCIAVTQGPGLAVALEVGIKKAKELADKYQKKLIAVNHLEGHIYSVFAQNRQGKPEREIKFPYLALLVSGGHTELIIFKDHLSYQVIGETIDDAAGEALDKAAKMLGLGYPGGPIIERLALEAGNSDQFKFPRPMLHSSDLNFSFSGLKTSFYYFLKKQKKEKSFGGPRVLRQLASSFQEAVFETLIKKTEKAIMETKINNLIACGGVMNNKYLRKLLRHLAKKHHGQVLFPPYKYLNGDNAAMIGLAAYYKFKKKKFITDINTLDRIPRMQLTTIY